MNTHCLLCGSKKAKPFSTHEEGDYFKCLSCGVLYAHPLPSREILLQQAEDWARIHHASPEKIASDFSPFIQKEIHLPRLRKIEKKTGRGKLLDLGCATGAFLHAAREAGWEACGVECAAESTRFGKEKGLDIITGAFPGISFPHESFQAVTMWEFLEHVDNPLDVLCDAHRVLRKNGVVALSTPNLRSLTRLFLRDQWDVLSPRMHLFLFTPASLRKALARAGFKKISIQSEDLNPLRILRSLRAEKKGMEAKEEKWEEKKKEMSFLKELLQKRGWARYARRTMNGFLKACRVGDVLLAYAQKGQR